jgi:murein DD-endopeptidase MepM/ murein hydrolase activator NlpD
MTALVIALIATFTALRLFLHSEIRLVTPIDSGNFQVDAGSDADDSFELPESAEPAPPSIVISTTLERTAPIESYLVKAGEDPYEARAWAELFRRVTSTRLLEKGQSFTVYKDPETSEVRGIKYDLDNRVAVTEAHLGNGVLKASLEQIEYFDRPVKLTFAVRDNFKQAAAENGIPQPIVQSLEDAFSERHNLNRLTPGSSVKLIYDEKVSRDGNVSLIGDLTAAQIRTGSHTLNAYSFADEHGRVHLYDDQGRPLGPQSLRFPLNFKYISSGFTYHRYHPILHEFRPHVGVDLAADYGTPVKAVADGKVQTSGWGGELGNSIRIEHQNGMVSIYGHLEKIMPNVKPGAYVSVGQVIGLVGSTGLSTGPHLHFALEKNGAFVNPLTQTIAENHRVSPRMQALFNDIKERYQMVLAQLPDVGSRAASTEQGEPESTLSEMYHETIHRIRSAHHSRHHHISTRGLSSGYSTGGGL